jgi:hypothetical protein
MAESNNPKLENVLNLALDVTNKEREKSVNLSVGYSPTEQTWELIVKFSGDITRLEKEYPGVTVKVLINEYAILNVPESLIDAVVKENEVEYVEKPKMLSFAVEQAIQSSCITPLQTAQYNLTGKGVMVAILDSGEPVKIMFE